jgi:Uma2 family endonuclease
LSQPALLPDVAQGNLRDLADRLLKTMRVEYVDEGVLLLMEPPKPEHRAIVRMMVAAIVTAVNFRNTPVDWEVNSENFQWELADGTDRFYIPDLVIVHPGARTPEAEQAQIALVAEVTSPASADTVHNDRVVKPAQYAKAGVPLYLLVDQERASWALHALAGSRPGYEVLSAGKFGTDVELPSPFSFAIPTGDWPTTDGA